MDSYYKNKILLLMIILNNIRNMQIVKNNFHLYLYEKSHPLIIIITIIIIIYIYNNKIMNI
jgi:hypothetical protein